MFGTQYIQTNTCLVENSLNHMVLTKTASLDCVRQSSGARYYTKILEIADRNGTCSSVPCDPNANNVNSAFLIRAGFAVIVAVLATLVVVT